MMTAYYWYFPPPGTDKLLLCWSTFLVIWLCCVCWKHLSEYGLLHKRIGLLHCISTDKTCSKGRRTPPVFLGDNWSYYYCCLLLFTRFILRISSNNKAIRPYRCSGRASANAKWDWRNGFIGLFFIGWFAGLLACTATQTRTCLDYRLLSWLPDPMIDWLIDYYRGSMFMLMFPMIIMYEASTGAYQPTLGPGQGPLGRKWRWIQQDRPDQTRSCRIRLPTSCCSRHLLCLLAPCLIFFAPRIPGLQLYPGLRYDANYALCTPYSSAYACMCA